MVLRAGSEVWREPGHLRDDLRRSNSVLHTFDRLADSQLAPEEVDRVAHVIGVILFRFGLPVPDHRGEEHPGLGLRFPGWDGSLRGVLHG